MPADSRSRAIRAIEFMRHYEQEKLRADAATSGETRGQHLRVAEDWLNLALETLREP
jgi:hypothetical protein